MITEEEYLKSKEIVQEYEKQLNISNIKNINCQDCKNYYSFGKKGPCHSFDNNTKSCCLDNFYNFEHK